MVVSKSVISGDSPPFLADDNGGRNHLLKLKSYVRIFGAVLLATSFAACGEGGGSSGNDPTLGITSIQKMGVTAIPNHQSLPSGKPVLARHFMRGIDFLFGRKPAYAASVSCASVFAPTSFDINGGKIWLEEVFMILDEVQFNTSLTSSESPDEVELGPFGLDLLNTEPKVPQAIDIIVPPGQYNNLRFRVKRVDDTQSATSGVHPNLITKIFDPGTRRRPSVWIKGWVSVASAPTTCRDFTFVTDRRWEETILFNKSSGGIVDAVLDLNLEKAFNAALDSLQKNATDLRNEIGGGTTDVMGPDFLDGRTKDPAHGTEIAEMVADQLPLYFGILIQAADVVDFGNFATGTSLIDDNATPVSQAVKIENVRDTTED